MHKMLKEDAARTADPKWIKGYSRPYVMLTNKTEGKVFHGAAAEEYLDISQLVVRVCFHFHSLLSFGFIYFLFLLSFSLQFILINITILVVAMVFLISIFKQFLSQAMNFLTSTFPVPLPLSHCKKSIWVPVWYFAGWS